MNLRMIRWCLVLNQVISHKKPAPVACHITPDGRGTKARTITQAMRFAGVLEQARPLPTHILPYHPGESL